MADKFYKTLPAKGEPSASGTVKSTSKKLPAKEEPKEEESGLALEYANVKKDQRVKKEQEAYEKGEKTRLRDQGGLKKGGSVSSASKRADGIAQRGKTRGKMV
jgi:hypothetical protein